MSLKHKSAFLFLPLLGIMVLNQNASAEPAAKKAATVAAAPVAKSETVAKSNPAASAVATTVPASDKAAAPASEKAAPASTGKKTCDDVKSEIEAKLKAKGVKAFTLDILPKADVKDAKVVGSCEAGSKKITYKRG